MRRCLLLLVVASLAIPGGTVCAFDVFVDISATDGYTQADPTGVATGGVAVLQGPMPTLATYFYDTFTYPGATTGTMTNLTTTFTSVNGRIGSTNMNASGQFVACETSPAFGTGSTGGWTYANGTATSLPYYYLPGPTQAYETYATAINNNGDTAGYYRATGGGGPTEPFIRTGGTDYGLTDTTTYGSAITALNTSGQAVGWTQSGGIGPPTFNAVVWTYTISGGAITSQTSLNLESKGGLATAFPDVYASTALAINNSGQVVVAVNSTTGGDNYVSLLQYGTAYAYLYSMSSQSYTYLDGLQIFDSQIPTGTGTQYGGHAQAINDSGQVVGRIPNTSGGYDAAIWQNGTVTDLNTLYAGILPAGFTLNNATAIDDQGDIAGYGTDAANNTNQAFVIYAPTPGDANLDGRVDINDLTIVLTNYNQTGKGWAQGEFIGDGTVDINDLTIVLAHYNDTTTPAAGGPAAVPEPCCLALLAAGLAGLLAYVWQKRR
jgi:probable HAF family extracellular repeat protein